MRYKEIPRIIVVSAALLIGLTACGALIASEPTPTPKGKWANSELGQRLEKMQPQTPAEGSVQAYVEASVQATIEARTAKSSEIDATSQLRNHFKQQWMEAFGCRVVRIYSVNGTLQCSTDPSIDSTYPDGAYIAREEGEMSEERLGDGTWLVTVRTVNGVEQWVVSESELPYQRELASNQVPSGSTYPVAPNNASGTFVADQVKDTVQGIWCGTALRPQCP